MTLPIGLAILLAALLIGRVSRIGGRLLPAPWWTHDSINAFLVVPAIVTAVGGGAVVIIAAFGSAGWHAMGVSTAGAAAAVVVAFVLLWNVIGAWSLRVPARQKAA
jgi:hypothetical protein